MPEYTYAKGRIAETVQFITREMKEFDDEYTKVTWDEYQRDSKTQKIIDRTVENILNALVEICGTVLAEEGKTADNYGETLRMAADMFGFKKDESKEFAKLASHRNRLVHRYLNMKWQAIRAYKEQALLIKRLMGAILERESKKEA
jgi:uncharacterized protein YutE (UPF0331/DUF86 family)